MKCIGKNIRYRWMGTAGPSIQSILQIGPKTLGITGAGVDLGAYIIMVMVLLIAHDLIWRQTDGLKFILVSLALFDYVFRRRLSLRQSPLAARARRLRGENLPRRHYVS